jgi:hypothetical protein
MNKCYELENHQLFLFSAAILIPTAPKAKSECLSLDTIRSQYDV